MLAALPAIWKSIRGLVCGEWRVQVELGFVCFLQCEFIGHHTFYKKKKSKTEILCESVVT